MNLLALVAVLYAAITAAEYFPPVRAAHGAEITNAKTSGSDDPGVEAAVGLIDELGAGVPANAGEAFKHYNNAAEKGDAFSEFKVGRAYEDGDGVSKDHSQAVKWLRKAAAQGNQPAKTMLDSFAATESSEKVAGDEIEKYNITKRSGRDLDACVQAGVVAAVFLQAKDEVNYRKWKDTEDFDCHIADESP